MKKKLLIILSFILFSNFYSNSFAQSFGIGYRVGSGSFKPLDFVIDRYNQTRTTILTKNMDKISSVSGLVYSAGYNFGEWGFEVEIPKLKSPVVTSETSTQVRELYMKLEGVEFGTTFGKEVYADGPIHGFFGGYLSVDNASPTILTRIYNKGGAAGNYSEISAKSAINIGLGPTLSAHMIFPSVIFFAEVRPFYKFSLTGADFYDVNAALNPNTWYNDDIDSTNGSMNYFGLNAKIGVTVAIL